jgi:hypothetical protein
VPLRFRLQATGLSGAQQGISRARGSDRREWGSAQASSLDEWQQRATRNGLNPATVLCAMKDLARVDAIELALRRKDALRSAVQLLHFGCDIRAMRRAKFIDAFANSMEAHPALLEGTHSFRNVRALVAATLDIAAQDARTYSDDFSTAQMVTAQATLRLYCSRFWGQVERRGLPTARARQVATVVHQAFTLAVELNAPPPKQRPVVAA